MTLDLRRVAAFVVIAEELNVTRAAQRLHTSQQALSASLSELERQLKVTLIDRSPRQLLLTEAGKLLYTEAKPLLAAADAVERRLRDVAANSPPQLRLAHSPAITTDEVYRLLDGFRSAHPDTTIIVEQIYPRELEGSLTSGRADVALLRIAPSLTPESSAFASAPVRFDRLRIAMAADHPLAHREKVQFSDLRDQEIVIWAPPGASGYTAFLTALCRSAGFEPRVSISPNQGLPPATSVAGNQRVAFVTERPGLMLDGAVQVVELEPPAYAPIEAVWLRAGLSSWARTFLDDVRAATPVE
ncbi:LysR family transcriptional regulator [Hoyosella subflava]|uniref:Putative transcriptional regulator, LysR family n=1 Tax=Hoyosella subflava (strain DSM 45089 / JCM 17490 / NBRC 109087 / DQS3-9A1) TaxID=443218 RepID=F6ENR6_HOYSD|nr:LysR family transcriptional regulator [Hoyosella subflava]AEF42923.1 Putative transcriptional regulator, LysR family [Hoyosella subflava DQS3-9A1]